MTRRKQSKHHSSAAWEERANEVMASLARSAAGMTGADIEEVVRQARRIARRENRSLTFADVDFVLTNLRPRRSDELLFRAACHEAAHAVVRVYLNAGDIRQITLNGNGGNAYVVGHQEMHESVTEERMMAYIIVLLSGRAAEQEFCGSVSAHSGGGEQSDLAQATRLAYALEMTSGLGRSYPLVYREPKDPFETLARNTRLAELVNARLEVSYEAARKIVAQQEKAIGYLAGCLLMWETLDGGHLKSILVNVNGLLKEHSQNVDPGAQASSSRS